MRERMSGSIPSPYTDMKSLLLSCKNFESKVKELATRPKAVTPEKVNQREYKSQKSIVALITVEEGDFPEDTASKLADEIRIFSKDTGIKTLVLCPFAHLSSKLASSEAVIKTLDALEKNLKELDIIRVHFGSHKSLLIDIHGHKGNVRFREF